MSLKILRWTTFKRVLRWTHHNDTVCFRRQLRRASSQHQIDEGQLSSSSTSPIQNRKPMMTSTPKKKVVTQCVECCNKSVKTEFTPFNSERFLPESKYEHQEKKDSCTMKVQTDTPITHRNVWFNESRQTSSQAVVLCRFLLIYNPSFGNK